MSFDICSLLPNRVLNYFPFHFIKCAELWLLYVALNEQQQCKTTMKWYLNFRWFGAPDRPVFWGEVLFLIIELHGSAPSERITEEDAQITSGIEIFLMLLCFFFSRKNPNNELIKMCVVLMTGQQIKPCKCFFAASFSWASDPRACFCPNLQHCSSWNSFWMERNTTRVAPSLDLTLLLLPFFFYLFFFIAGLFSFATFREKSPPLSGTWVNSAAASAAGARI